jgi:triacylglycerol lipase
MSPSPPGDPALAAPSLPHVGLAGVNDPGCRSTEPPVVLLHGSFSTLASNFAALAPALRASGRCVFGLEYGPGGVDAVRNSATAVTAFVATVREITHADRIDAVGYSQGGLVLRTAMRWDGLAAAVRVAILIAPSFHGTTSPLARAVPASVCPACADQVAGSALLRDLAAGGDLDGTVRYAVVTTADDVVVTPVSSQIPTGPPDRVRSISVQRACPGTRVDHVALPGYPGVVHWVVAALDADGRPAPAALTCG